MNVPSGIPSTYDKVLQLNLDPQIYGTFAEIGAGQEVANWFFRASATAGTVAKSISAYDMTMSDAIYGKGDRYVSRQRLRAMLDHEYTILVERLTPGRGGSTTFFSFCNTVRARAWKDFDECHGWLGIRYQSRPGEESADIFIHVRLLDQENTDQMEALGILGVNLIYAAFYHRGHLRRFAESLIENLTPGRVEVDMLKFHGSRFEFVDNRLCALQLVESGLTPAAMILPDGDVVQPAEALYKRSILLLRGSFNPVMRLHLDMLDQARKTFGAQAGPAVAENCIELCEISTRNLLREGVLDHLGFLDRADALQALGKTVLVSNLPEFHRVGTFLSRYTTAPVGIVLSIGLLNELFKEKWSENLPGGILESFGRLFKHRLRLFVYPWCHRNSTELVTVENFRSPEAMQHLYQHLVENGLIAGIDSSDVELLRHTGRDLANMVRAGDLEWERFVPEVAQGAARRAFIKTAGAAG